MGEWLKTKKFHWANATAAPYSAKSSTAKVVYKKFDDNGTMEHARAIL